MQTGAGISRARLVGLTMVCTALLVAAVPSDGLAAKRKRGIDVSRFQGQINWKQVGETKVRFAFVQASRGSGDDCAVAPDRCGFDEYYERNYRRARAQGIRVGAYHRAFAGGNGRRGVKRDARTEARLFVSTVGELQGGDLLPALDVEIPFSGLNEWELRRWIRTWLGHVEEELGAKPIIYTNHSSWQATGDTTSFARAGHPLWVANWGVREPAVPASNWYGAGWAVWQFTSTGRVRGVDGDVDKNRLGVRLREITVREDPPPAPPEPEPPLPVPAR